METIGLNRESGNLDTEKDGLALESSYVEQSLVQKGFVPGLVHGRFEPDLASDAWTDPEAIGDSGLTNTEMLTS
jgi:hypothetical protein